MTETIGEVAVGSALHAWHLIGDHGVTQDHPILIVFVVGHEGGQPLHEPGRRIAGDGLAQLPLKEDVELENVGQLVLDQLQQLLVGGIDRDDHAVPDRLGERSDLFR